MIDEKTLFISELKVIWEHIIKFKKLIIIDDYTTGCLLDYKHYKRIMIELSKQQALDADPKAIKQVLLEI